MSSAKEMLSFSVVWGLRTDHSPDVFHEHVVGVDLHPPKISQRYADLDHI